MARALIVGCGCRGRQLGERLLAEGWAVRGTSRREEGLAAIEAAGIEPALADPDRPGTVLELVGDVAVVVLAARLGRRASAEELAAIHGAAARAAAGTLVDTPVRGFVYEAAGSVEPTRSRPGGGRRGRGDLADPGRGRRRADEPADGAGWRLARRALLVAGRRSQIAKLG